MRSIFTNVSCGVLLDECSTFIRHENGKLKHEEGKMDDCVIAAGITLQVSMMMGTIVEKKIKPKTNFTTKRIEALEQPTTDDYEVFISTESVTIVQDL
jgi:hypothetical protein